MIHYHSLSYSPDLSEKKNKIILLGQMNFKFQGTKEYAEELDKNDELAFLQNEFIFPPAQGNRVDSHRKKALYLCGNSLGLLPKDMKTHVNAQFDKWGAQGVEGHFTEPTPWLTIDDIVQESTSKLVGSQVNEVVVMNSLTVNLHLMMCAFYNPTTTRHKILIGMCMYVCSGGCVYV